MNTRLESLSAEVNRLSARVDELSRRLDSQSRPSGGSSGPSPRPTPAPTPSPSGGSKSSNEPGAEESYKAAYSDFTKGNYTLAIAEFREFVRQNPDSPRVDSAQYWIGESYFSIGRAAAAAGQSERSREALERSVQEFRKVFVNYPGGRQVPTALYKEALALVELKQMKVAQARLQYLVDNFPQSEEAPLAQPAPEEPRRVRPSRPVAFRILTARLVGLVGAKDPDDGDPVVAARIDHDAAIGIVGGYILHIDLGGKGRIVHGPEREGGHEDGEKGGAEGEARMSPHRHPERDPPGLANRPRLLTHDARPHRRPEA
jgi:TolA-binding protein